mmetsp:Transcript_59663/g.166584  ORF Transcript_59663/g.166584 Transcript_59663/m.166584 type:complete len:351 (-) Transcript_59663:135-1187(-)
MVASPRSSYTPRTSLEVMSVLAHRLGSALRWARRDLYVLHASDEFPEEFALLARPFQRLGTIIMPDHTLPLQDQLHGGPRGLGEVVSVLAQVADTYGHFDAMPAAAGVPACGALRADAAAPAPAPPGSAPIVRYHIGSSSASTTSRDDDIMDSDPVPSSRSSPSDAIAQTTLDGTNTVVIDDPALLITSACHNLCCSLACDVAAAASDIDSRMHADFAAINAPVASSSSSSSSFDGDTLASSVASPPPLACLAARALVRRISVLRFGSGCTFAVTLDRCTVGHFRLLIVHADPFAFLADVFTDIEFHMCDAFDLPPHVSLQLIVKTDTALASSLSSHVMSGFLTRCIDSG